MIRTTRGALLLGLTLLILVLISIPLGRAERARALRNQEQTMERIVHLTPDGIDRRGLSAYRLTPDFDCLLYRAGANPYALEFCFDGLGRLVEAIDRRNEKSLRIGSLRYDPSATPIVVPPQRLARFFRGIKGVSVAHGIPLGIEDVGPVLYKSK